MPLTGAFGTLDQGEWHHGCLDLNPLWWRDVTTQPPPWLDPHAAEMHGDLGGAFHRFSLNGADLEAA
ncbi:MAG: hypothetical protein AB8E87_08605 [Prochlorococcus sp.]